MTYQRWAGTVYVSLDFDDPTGDTTVVMLDTKNQGPYTAGPSLRFTREGWTTFLQEVTDDLPSDNGAVEVTEAERVTTHARGGDRVTHWHVRDRNTGGELHFDHDEWNAFRRAAADGVFALPPVLHR